MSLIATHRLLRSARRRLLLAVAVLAVLGTVAAHHGMPSDMHAMPAAAMCLAVVGAFAAVALTAAVAPAGLRWPSRGLPSFTLRVYFSAPPRAATRDGPLHLRLQVLRR
jgi:hypothetical protein